MPGMMLAPWILLVLLSYSVLVTLITNWLAAGRQRPAFPRSVSLADVVAAAANLIWIALVYAAGVIAARYVERFAFPALGYLVFGLVAFALSWVRAVLFRRIQEQEEPGRRPVERPWLFSFVHNAIYVLFAVTLYLVLSWALGRSANPILFVLLGIGALLPDLDSQQSVLGRLLPFVSSRLKTRFGHLQEVHSAGANICIAVITSPLILLIGVEAWFSISVGFFAHLLIDLLTPQGVMLFWPLTGTRYKVFGGPLVSPGAPVERRLFAVLVLVATGLLLVVDVGPPAPPPAAVPSCDQVLDQYYSLRGNNLVFAYVEGSWNRTGRSIRGRFEILNAVGESFVMLDCYDGKVFTAGRSPGDDLYLNRISLQPGPSASVKPVEIQLRGQLLADALPVVYQMQREPGLQHIYVTGDIVVPAKEDGAGLNFEVDLAQTGLRRIVAENDAGHYSFHYLTASDLIELVNLPVEAADLVIVATYASATSGPTVTPLPSPPSTPEPSP